MPTIICRPLHIKSSEAKGRYLAHMLESGGDLDKAVSKWREEVIRRFIAASVLPTNMRRGVEQKLIQAGIGLREPLEDDRMFRSAILGSHRILGVPHLPYWYDLVDSTGQRVAHIYVYPGNPTNDNPPQAFIELA